MKKTKKTAKNSKVKVQDLGAKKNPKGGATIKTGWDIKVNKSV